MQVCLRNPVPWDAGAVQRVHSYGRRSSLRLFCGNKGGGRSVVAFHAGAGKGRKQAEFNRRGKRRIKIRLTSNVTLCARLILRDFSPPPASADVSLCL